jgi:putative acetyltransferase
MPPSVPTHTAPVTIREAAGAGDLALVKRLFAEYAAWLGVDLSFQGFDAELASLPGAYARPSGRVLLAECDGSVVGCVALRALAEGVGEIKRLYVLPGVRGRGVGRRLMQQVIDEARAIGYARLRLDTLPNMAAARDLYNALGFRPIPPYYHNPIEGTQYMELTLY